MPSLLVVWEGATTKSAYDHRRRYFLENNSIVSRTTLGKKRLSILFKQRTSHALRYAIEEIIDHIQKPTLDVLMNLLDSHDTERIITNWFWRYRSCSTS